MQPTATTNSADMKSAICQMTERPVGGGFDVPARFAVCAPMPVISSQSLCRCCPLEAGDRRLGHLCRAGKGGARIQYARRRLRRDGGGRGHIIFGNREAKANSGISAHNMVRRCVEHL